MPQLSAFSASTPQHWGPPRRSDDPHRSLFCRHTLQVGIVANTKTFAQAAVSVAGGIGSAVVSTAGSVVRFGVGMGLSTAETFAPMGVFGALGAGVIGTVVGAATGLVINAPVAFNSVRGGFGSAANIYAQHDAE